MKSGSDDFDSQSCESDMNDAEEGNGRSVSKSKSSKDREYWPIHAMDFFRQVKDEIKEAVRYRKECCYWSFSRAGSV